MKHLIVALIVSLIFNTHTVFAHGEHDIISIDQAIEVAVKNTKKLTLKDFGFDVGKLSKSWKGLSSEDFILYSEETDQFIISANNKVDNTKIYFSISISGEVLNVTLEAQ